MCCRWEMLQDITKIANHMVITYDYLKSHDNHMWLLEKYFIITSNRSWRHWFRLFSVTCSGPSHYLNQRWCEETQHTSSKSTDFPKCGIRTITTRIDTVFWCKVVTIGDDCAKERRNTSNAVKFHIKSTNSKQIAFICLSQLPMPLWWFSHFATNWLLYLGFPVKHIRKPPIDVTD